jgi:hypothetical protein
LASISIEKKAFTLSLHAPGRRRTATLPAPNARRGKARLRSIESSVTIPTPVSLTREKKARSDARRVIMLAPTVSAESAPISAMTRYLPALRRELGIFDNMHCHRMGMLREIACYQPDREHDEDHGEKNGPPRIPEKRLGIRSVSHRGGAEDQVLQRRTLAFDFWAVCRPLPTRRNRQ